MANNGLLPSVSEAVDAIRGFTSEQHAELLNYLGEAISALAPRSEHQDNFEEQDALRREQRL
eukprot:SAG11_NODE_979_length_6319_cov_2.950322_7_plen_62_part_00